MRSNIAQHSTTKNKNHFVSPPTLLDNPGALEQILFTQTPVRELQAGLLKKLLDDFTKDIRSKKKVPSTFIRTLEEILFDIPAGTEILEWMDVLQVHSYETQWDISIKWGSH